MPSFCECRDNLCESRFGRMRPRRHHSSCPYRRLRPATRTSNQRAPTHVSLTRRRRPRSMAARARCTGGAGRGGAPSTRLRQIRGEQDYLSHAMPCHAEHVARHSLGKFREVRCLHTSNVQTTRSERRRRCAGAAVRRCGPPLFSRRFAGGINASSVSQLKFPVCSSEI